MIPAIASTLYRKQANNNNGLSGVTSVSNLNSYKTKQNNYRTTAELNNHFSANSNTNSLIKETELSTKNSTKDNFLDYTFLSHRSQISSDKRSNITKSNEYVFDLINTWELNVDLMENVIKETTKKSEGADLINLISNIKSKFEKKKELRVELSNLKGKILIENQIIEEYKRKSEENDDYYNEQLKECDENKENKEEYLKIFEKKLKEVEIYVQKNTKNLTNSKFEIYKDFKITDFININTDLLKRKENLYKEINEIKTNLEQLKNENKNFKNDMNFSFTEEEEEGIEIEKDKNAFNIYNSDICCMDDNNNELPVQITKKKSKNKKEIKDKLNERAKDKLKQFYQECIKRVRVEEMRNKLMKNYLNEMAAKFKRFDLFEYKKSLDRNNAKKQLESDKSKATTSPIIPFNNVDIDGDEINNNESETDGNSRNYEREKGMSPMMNDKSNINLDITRKMATMMDFSVILNKKPGDETNIDFGLNNTGLGMANDKWDISCIGKN